MQELHELRRSAWLSRDMQEGVSAFFQKRVPDFQGS
jgi:enoyl-CoA hydratase/carnithine racemase